MNDYLFNGLVMLIFITNWLAGGNAWTAALILTMFVLCQKDASMEMSELHTKLKEALHVRQISTITYNGVRIYANEDVE